MVNAMLQFDFENSVGYWVFATTHELQRAMNEELAAHGITYRQWEVLAWISMAGEQSQSALAERMSIEPPTLVGVLDRMERDGWIERVPADGDRRKKLIRPTSRVEPLWNRMVACAHRVARAGGADVTSGTIGRIAGCAGNDSPQFGLCAGNRARLTGHAIGGRGAAVDLPSTVVLSYKQTRGPGAGIGQRSSPADCHYFPRCG